MAKEPFIRDIPSIKKIVQDVKTLKTIKRIMPLLRPFLKLLGIDTSQIDIQLAKTEELERMTEELASIPDRFNNLFAPRGWIIYELMNVEVAKAAVEKAESGDIDGAELDLINYYNEETVKWKLQTMIAVKKFRPRMTLAQKALKDYKEGRYHACVPVVLSLLDGLANEIHQLHRGFFADGADLKAWNSLAGHSKGLNILANILRKGRYKTTTELITIPYRHGIIHGMDLGYDNKMVAAKTWAALFAVRNWALKAEQGLLKPPPPETTKTWKQILHGFSEIDCDKELLRKWKPRIIQLGKDIPTTGKPDTLGNNTPEQKLVEFLLYWKTGNYGFMAQCLSAILDYDARVAPARVRAKYESKRLKFFEFTEISDDAPATTEIQTKLVYEEDGKEVETSVRFRMIYENPEGQVSIRGKSGSKWKVIDLMLV